MIGMFQGVGPCEVIEVSKERLGTRAREWGWDRSSNMLFIDQPNQVGFSYDVLVNGSLDLFTSMYSFPPVVRDEIPSEQQQQQQQSWYSTVLNGTFSSNNVRNTANTTGIAARAVWHILQGFLGAFPQYNPDLRLNYTRNSSSIGINLFTESYGGKYGPAFASYFEEQNARLDRGELSARNTLKIHLRSLGILQGCVDDMIQGRFYPKFAYSNTYGIRAVSLVDEQNMASSFLGPGGCREQIQQCRDTVQAMDPDDTGDVDMANNICAAAQEYCNDNVIGPYTNSNLSIYDISQSVLDPFPPNLYLEYLNTAAVQASIGAPLNFTSSSATVLAAFKQTGDHDRGGQIAELASLLDKGIRVALIYGDRDYICNWQGGEAVSFSVASSTFTSWYSFAFNAAGYAPIITNRTYIGGVVRQVANLSFSRIYDAGHLIPAYQPETMFTLFTRIILGTDLSSGQRVNLTTFQTQGDPNSTATNSAPPKATPTCFLRSISDTCDEKQKEKLRSGSGVIINGILYDHEKDWSNSVGNIGDGLLGDVGVPGMTSLRGMASSVTSSSQSSTQTTMATGSTTSTPATGVFTATSTPSMVDQRSTSGGVPAVAVLRPGQWPCAWLMMVLVLIVSIMRIL